MGHCPFPSRGKFLTKINSNSHPIESRKKKEKKKRKKKKKERAFLLNFYLCFWPLGSLYALLHFLSSSPSPLCPHAANVYLRGCWLHHGMQTGRLIKPPSTYISSLLSLLSSHSVSSQNLSLLDSCSMTIYACIRAGFWQFPP